MLHELNRVIEAARHAAEKEHENPHLSVALRADHIGVKIDVKLTGKGESLRCSRVVSWSDVADGRTNRILPAIDKATAEVLYSGPADPIAGGPRHVSP